MANRKICFLSTAIIAFFQLSIFCKAQTSGSIQKTTAKSDSAQLLNLEYRWLKAEFSLDTGFVSSLMAPDFMAITPNNILSKNQELVDEYRAISQRLRDSIYVDSFRLEEPVVRMYGITAIVVFVVHTYGTNKGAPYERRTRFYDVWIKQKGTWKAVSSQGTMVSN